MAITRAPFGAAVTAARAGSAAKALSLSPLADLGTARAVFVNGRFRRDLSAAPKGRGLWAGSLAEALATRGDAVASRYGTIVPPSGGAFAALNAALAEDAAVVVIDADADVAGPIHVLHLAVTDSDREAAYPRTLVVAMPGSRATVIETHLGDACGSYLTDAVTEIDLGDGASLEHCRIEADTASGFHVASVRARQGRGARLASNVASIGSGFARVDVGTTLAAEGAECLLNGLYLAGDHRHVDHYTSVEHAAPHGTSHQLYKGILSGAARAVFTGRIRVAEGAQGTDALQSNRNLLLSSDALVHTRPQLEIRADDVRCTHGATIGRLDAESLFYLRSRGIGEADARRLLIEAFMGEVVGRIGFGPLREKLSERVRASSALLPAEGGAR